MPAKTDLGAALSAKTCAVQAAGSNAGLAHVEGPDGSGAFVAAVQSAVQRSAVGLPAGAVTMFVVC